MVVVCKNCGHFRKKHRIDDLRCPAEVNVNGGMDVWLETSYEVSAKDKARISQARINPASVKKIYGTWGNCGLPADFPPAKKSMGIAAPVKSELVIDGGTKLVEVLNTQIISILTNNPGVEVREVFSLEEPKSLTLIFSRAK